MTDIKQITTKQCNELISVLAEFPAKHTYGAIQLLQNLPEEEVEIIEKKTDKKK